MSDRDYRQVVNGWLEDLRRYLATNERLVLDVDGICSVHDRSGLLVDIELPNGANTVYVYTALCVVEPHSRDEQFTAALSLNMFQIQTAGGSVAFDEPANELMYCRSFECNETDSQKFSNCYFNFTRYAMDLKSKLSGSHHSAQGGGYEEETPQRGSSMGQLGGGMIPPGFSIKV